MNVTLEPTSQVTLSSNIVADKSMTLKGTDDANIHMRLKDNKKIKVLRMSKGWWLALYFGVLGKKRDSLEIHKQRGMIRLYNPGNERMYSEG